jgi:hypothetical protein
MKASFFDYVKANFINDLEDNENILSVENAEGAKAATENAGDAYVEYSMEISFKASKHIHVVKLIAYTTTSQLMFQPVGEKNILDKRVLQGSLLKPSCFPGAQKKSLKRDLTKETLQCIQLLLEKK